MKKFAIETNQNYVEVMKKILSECRVSGKLDPILKKQIGETVAVNASNTYKCRVSGNKIKVELDISYRNSFAPAMDLEILTAGDRTRINGVISSLFSDDLSRQIIIVFVLIVSLGLLILQAVRFFSTAFISMDWVIVGISAVLFLSLLLTLFNDKKGKNKIASADPYEVQMEHWISNLFPGEYKSLEK